MDNVSVPSNSSQASQVRYAGFGIRFLAYWVDFIILFPLGFIIQQMIGNNPFAIFQSQTLSELQKVQTSASSPLGVLISLGCALAFFLIFWVNYDGATPGKKLLGIKIVKVDGKKLTYPVAFIRYIGYMISAATIFFFGLGYLWIIWDKKKQALHDKIAGTIVVRTEKKPQTALAVLLTLAAMFLLFGYMGAAMFKGFTLGMQEVQKKKLNSIPAQNLQQNKESMAPEAKVHYDKTQTLFKQLQTTTDSATIKILAQQLIQEGKAAADAQPNNPMLWSNLGDAYTWMNIPGSGDQALNAYQKAEQLMPNDATYINNVGGQLVRNGKNDEAVLQFQKTLRITSDSGYAYFGIGQAYENLKIYDEARTNYTKAISVFQAENTNGGFDTIILNVQKALAGLPK